MGTTGELAADDARPGKRPYYRPTTASQRKHLFQVDEQTTSPRKACAAAHVGISTFYHWRHRFEAGGYAALEETQSHTPHTFAHQLPAVVVEEVLAAKREHPIWGRQRGPEGTPDELTKGHDWQAVVSPSEVRRILIAGGLMSPEIRPPKR